MKKLMLLNPVTLVETGVINLKSRNKLKGVAQICGYIAENLTPVLVSYGLTGNPQVAYEVGLFVLMAHATSGVLDEKYGRRAEKKLNSSFT